MIRSVRHRGLRRLIEHDDPRGLHADLVSRVRDVIANLQFAKSPEEMDLPGYRLHRLRGNLAGFWAVRVTGNYRLVFRMQHGEALDVDLVDYH